MTWSFLLLLSVPFQEMLIDRQIMHRSLSLLVNGCFFDQILGFIIAYSNWGPKCHCAAQFLLSTSLPSLIDSSIPKYLAEGGGIGGGKAQIA